MNFKSQLDRIKQKLELVQLKDKELKVFGANEHQYLFHAPISSKKVKEFERSYGIELPKDYVAFITTMGNGGPGHYGGAGPYYGIYALGEFGFMPTTASSMSSPCVITSTLTEDDWDDLTEFERNDSIDQESEAYDRKYNSLFNGLMSIDTQGCNGQIMLALNGKDKGRIVYIDQDLNRPKVREEGNFLDWYEKWLDDKLRS